MFEWNQIAAWIYVVFLLTAIPVVFMIILEKRSPFKTAAWIMVLILIPILGVIFYLVFGQEYRKRKIFSRKGLKGLKRMREMASVQLREIGHTQSTANNQIHDNRNTIRLLLNNSNVLLTTGNQLKLLKDGTHTFEAIFSAIEAARHHIHLEYYIFSDDKIGTRLKELLVKKRAQGVEVRIIVDDVGSWDLRKKYFADLRNKGIEIYPFMEVRFPRLTSRVNYRNHRKIIVIDGKTGFLGGINIADRYIDGAPKLGHWRDTHLEIKGDAAACLQVIFTADWYFVSKRNIYGYKYFPKFTEASGTPVQIAASGPDYDWEAIAQAFFSAITNARKKVYLVTPYLMPPPTLLFALQTAALSNIDVRIIIPEKSDSRISKWASFSYVEKLLEAGVRIFFYKKGFIHSKYMLVDDVFSTLGTSNFDFRSFETNFETNAFIYNSEFSQKLEAHFMDDLQNSREIKLEQWHQRSSFFKVRESLAHIISPMF
ncbi:cardiolipin synthase [Prolixibacteraceae bacterium Z1-6]|uniref:Cardiolipin synthase n=1 Tax=Draconibacterium aestuarii TaxID=2998507 RepID=A0A9X3FIS8_9BACT|nr:cardiolipin synthase [Prolixibacteraceae bacterium Z1-6]